MKIPQRFIIVDDDRSNNLICEFALRRFANDLEVKTFLDPEIALRYIEDEYSHTTVLSPTVLFLDINMPILTGWDFLEVFESFDSELKQQFSIFILTSSIDHRDQQKAEANLLVEGFLSKPLSTKIINELFDQD